MLTYPACSSSRSFPVSGSTCCCRASATTSWRVLARSSARWSAGSVTWCSRVAGLFTDRSLTLANLPREQRDLPAWVDFHAQDLEPALLEDLRRVADDAQDLLDEERRACLVHSNLNAENLLVDPETFEVTGVLDWELAHSGLPWTDLGNLLRFDRQPAFLEAVLAAYTELMPTVPDNLLDLARAADLFALVELATRRNANEVVLRAREHLWAIARTGDLHAAP